MSDDLRTVLTGVFLLMVIALVVLASWTAVVVARALGDLTPTQTSRRLIGERVLFAVAMAVLFLAVQPLILRDRPEIRTGLFFLSFVLLIVGETLALAAWDRIARLLKERRVVRAIRNANANLQRATDEIKTQ